MQKKKYSFELGGTAGCSARLIEATKHCGSSVLEERRRAKEEEKRESVEADSWFSSKKLAEWCQENGIEYFGALKTNHGGTPKEELEKIMKPWPAGSYLVLECKKDKVFMVGYKYNYKKKGMSLRCSLFVFISLLVIPILTNSVLLFGKYASLLERGILVLLYQEIPTLQSGLTNMAT